MDIATLVDELLPIIILGVSALIFLLGIGFAALITGYWMGRNSAEKPIISRESKTFDPGPTDEPEEGDIFREALEDGKDRRMPTF